MILSRKAIFFKIYDWFHGVPSDHSPCNIIMCSHWIWLDGLSEIHSWGKGCYIHIWGNKIGMDGIFVLPVGWNWHEIYLWLLPHEILPYIVRTFTLMPSGIVVVQTRTPPPSNLPSHCGKFESTIAFFSILTDCSNNVPSNRYRY